jgi:hypothetical protein
MQRAIHHKDAERVSAEFKATVALEAIRGHETVTELATKQQLYVVGTFRTFGGLI